MDARPKLTTAQNLQLKGLSLQEKLNLLHDWKKRGEITPRAFEHFSNRWIRKESKKAIQEKNVLRRLPSENLERPMRFSGKLAVECDINNLISKLRHNLNLYISERSLQVFKLSDQDRAQFKEYVIEYLRSCRILINRLVIIGLRYPDKELNQFCVGFIRDYKKNPPFVDYYFWGMLWEDEDFVPLDAIRVMVIKKDNQYDIDPIFEKGFIKSIIPLMEAQRDKEAIRLAQAQMLEGRERERQIARKMHRLNAFNTLIEAAQRY